MFKRVMLLLLLAASSLLEALDPALYRFDGLFEHTIDNNRYGLIEKIIEPADVILEAGGYDGTDTVQLAKIVPQGKLITFEPNPGRYQEIVEKTKDISNVETHPYALGEINGTVPFYVCHGTSNDRIFEGASSVLPSSEAMKEHYKGPIIEVPCIVLDDWCAKNGVDKIDFMWLDLEGFELQMLKSSPQILSTVKAIHIETNFFEFRKGMTLYPTLRRFLKNNGFRMLSHWYYKGYQGDAIFVRTDMYDEIVQKVNQKLQEK